MMTDALKGISEIFQSANPKLRCDCCIYAAQLSYTCVCTWTVRYGKMPLFNSYFFCQACSGLF